MTGSVKKAGGKVALTGVRKEGDDGLAGVLRKACEAEGCVIRRAGGDAYKQALPPGQGLRTGVGVLVGDRDDPVNHIRGIGLRHEAGADALDLVLARGSAGEHRRTGRLRSEDLYGGIVLLESLSGAAYGPAGPDAGDEDIYLAFGVLPDLLPGRPFVGRRVGRILELLRLIPSAPGVSSIFAPKAFRRLRLSTLIVSGIVRITL